MIRILIVEDEVEIARMYQFKLEKSGYEIKCAVNGKEGLELAKEFRPKLILLDLKMPVMSGEEMLEHMRSQDWGSGIRVIVLTNISRDEAPSSLRLLAVDRYIVKAHYTPSQVLEVVDELVKLAGPGA
jgi:DNA-binding response OmpR family regulator